MRWAAWGPRLTDFLKGHGGLAGVLVIFFVSRAVYFDLLPRWDASVYFHFLLDALRGPWKLRHFDLAGHPSFPYALYFSLGQIASFGSVALFHFQNALLGLASVFCVFQLLKYFATLAGPRAERFPFELELASLLFVFSPLVFATSLGPNLDYPSLIFLVWLMCGLAYEKYAFALFAGFLLCFTKETGVLLYAALCAPLISAYAILGTVKAFDRSARFKSGAARLGETLLRLSREVPFKEIAFALALVLPALFWYVYVKKLQGGGMWNGHKLGAMPGGSILNLFAVKPAYLQVRLMEIFLLNFNWIFTATALVLGALAIRRWWKSKAGDRRVSRSGFHGLALAISMICAFSAFALFNLLYVTNIHARYLVPLQVFIVLAPAVLGFYALAHRKILRAALLTVLLGASLAQCYRTVDPVSLGVFPTFAFGESRMIGLGLRADELVYNAQFAQIERLLNRANRALPIEESTVVLFDRDSWWAASIDVSCGPEWPIYLDAITRKRTFDSNGAYRPRFVKVDEATRDLSITNAFFIGAPWVDNPVRGARFDLWWGDGTGRTAKLLDGLRGAFEVAEVSGISCGGLALPVYRLSRK